MAVRSSSKADKRVRFSYLAFMKLLCTLKESVFDSDEGLFIPEGTIVEVIGFDKPKNTEKLPQSFSGRFANINILVPACLLKDVIIENYEIPVFFNKLKFYQLVR